MPFLQENIQALTRSAYKLAQRFNSLVQLGLRSVYIAYIYGFVVTEVDGRFSALTGKSDRNDTYVWGDYWGIAIDLFENLLVQPGPGQVLAFALAIVRGGLLIA